MNEKMRKETLNSMSDAIRNLRIRMFEKMTIEHDYTGAFILFESYTQVLLDSIDMLKGEESKK